LIKIKQAGPGPAHHVSMKPTPAQPVGRTVIHANEMRDAFMRAMEFRHACRDFDPSRPLARADLDFVLEAGRLSPSSIGLEPWHFIVAENARIRKVLQKACADQPQVGSAAAVVVIAIREADLDPDSPYVGKMFRAHTSNHDGFLALHKFYRDFAARNDLTAWAIAQCHIAAANMMTGAAIIGVDSCPIGAFEQNAVLEAVAVEPHRYAVALVLALGYRRADPPPKQRLPLAELVDYL
jgi:nitroreductase